MGRTSKSKLSKDTGLDKVRKKSSSKGRVRKKSNHKPPRLKQAAHKHHHLSDTTLKESTGGFSANWKALAEVLGLQTARKQDKDDKKPGSTSIKLSAKRTRPSESIVRRSGPSITTGGTTHKTDVKLALITGNDKSVGKCVAMDCEMVGTGPDGSFSMLARCSVVNHHGNVLYDSFVAPMDVVTDYRTQVSGIKPSDLKGAPSFSTVQKDVSDLSKGKLLVGHALHHDLKALMLSHPRRDIRDTSNYNKFRQLSKGRRPSLKKLAEKLLGVGIHQREHDSVEDARVAMRLYQLHKKEWETVLKRHTNNK